MTRRTRAAVLLCTAPAAITAAGAGLGPFPDDAPRAASPGSGALAPLPGRAACLLESGKPRRCLLTRLPPIADLAISPDGRQLYVASRFTIWTFRRDPGTGVLQRVHGPAGCVRQWGPRRCVPARGLAGIERIVVSPDGRNLYALAGRSHSVVVLRRDRASGQLTQLTPVRGSPDFGFPVVSPDGRNLYVSTDAGWEASGGRAGAVSSSCRGVWVAGWTRSESS